jgi:hypothetical protein
VVVVVVLVTARQPELLVGLEVEALEHPVAVVLLVLVLREMLVEMVETMVLHQPEVVVVEPVRLVVLVQIVLVEMAALE